MNILFISPTIPYPATDGGRIRVLNLLKQLIRRGRVRLIAPRTQPTDDEGVVYLRSLGIATYLAERPAELPKITPAAILRSSIYKQPLTVAKYYFPAVTQLIRESLFAESLDLVHFEMLHTVPYMRALMDSALPKVLSLQNVDSELWRRLAAQSRSPIRKWLYGHQASQFRRYERRIADRFHLATCVSERDRDALAQICPQLEIAVVPNGVDVDSYQPQPELEEAHSIVFTGWPPNEDAVFFFVQHIWPTVKQRIPDARFYVVGQHPSKRLQQLGDRKDVIVTGRVEDTRPYIARGAVYVVPLRIGGGTRLKILEAFGMRRAVVSTSVGSEGLHVAHGENIVICDEPDVFASAVIRLLEEPSIREKIAASGRELAEREYDWKQIGADLYRTYEQLIARFPRKPSPLV